MNPHKPFYQTSEFWAVVAVNLGSVVGALAGMLKPEQAALAAAISNGLYSVGRSLVKQAQITSGAGEAQPAPASAPAPSPVIPPPGNVLPFQPVK